MNHPSGCRIGSARACRQPRSEKDCRHRWPPTKTKPGWARLGRSLANAQIAWRVCSGASRVQPRLRSTRSDAVSSSNASRSASLIRLIARFGVTIMFLMTRPPPSGLEERRAPPREWTSHDGRAWDENGADLESMSLLSRVPSQQIVNLRRLERNIPCPAPKAPFLTDRLHPGIQRSPFCAVLL